MTAIPAELSLAMSIAAKPGVFAILVGSGISRSAGIPTGWEVVEDLIRKVSAAEGEEAQPSPEEWYVKRFGSEPSYSTLLEALAKTAAERQALLRSYFEPTDEDREQGLKAPTKAHHAIAKMAASDLIRVLITTNFDRLLEQALDAAGVAPAVISTADQAEGAVPLVHSRCTVIKLHGDYMDARIKNSPQEIATYDPRMDSLLDQVFDEYGLIVSGWSAEYDTALRAALDRVRSRRYTTYWNHRGSLKPEAESLIQHRRAEEIEAAGADEFFSGLSERVEAIIRAGRQHPLGAQASVEALKRFLPESRDRIRLHELVRDATERVVTGLESDDLGPHGTATADELQRRVDRYRALVEELAALLANGLYWDTGEHRDVWCTALERLTRLPLAPNGAVILIGLARLPAVIALYAAGIAATATKGVTAIEALRAILLDSTVNYSDEVKPLAQVLFQNDVLSQDAAQLLRPPLEKKYKTPFSDLLCDTLRPVFRDLIPSDTDYVGAFDRFEYLVTLVQADLSLKEFGGLGFAGGAFEWRRDPAGRRLPVILGDEIIAAGAEWPPLKAGFFEGSLDRLIEVKAKVDEAIVRFGGNI